MTGSEQALWLPAIQEEGERCLANLAFLSKKSVVKALRTLKVEAPGEARAEVDPLIELIAKAMNAKDEAYGTGV